jgi:hypothetical protein
MAERDLTGLLGKHALPDLDAGVEEALDPSPLSARIWIAERDHGAGRLGGGNDIGASGPAASGVRARLEGHIERRALGTPASPFKRDRLGMGAATRRGPAARENLT